MITDSQTNTVFLADTLPKREFNKFKSFLIEHGVRVQIINRTDDYYCRDYMPVQVNENDFVQFVFKPDYYKPDELDLITNPIKVILANKLKNIRYSNIILDGGNLVKWDVKVIITDKVLIDNRYQFTDNDSAIITQLEKELKCQVLIIPADPEDKVGHSDGMVRFIDENTVFINDPLGGPKKWQKQFHDSLKQYQLEGVKLPCTMDDPDSADGLYINYLHVGNLVVVPQFGKGHMDKEAFEVIKDVMGTKCHVVKYNAKKISENGGVLNCATWTIRN